MNISEKIRDIDLDFLKRNAEKITDNDIERAATKADEIENKFRKGGPLDRFIEDGKLLLAVIRDYLTGNYRRIPYWAIAAIVFTLLYVLNPMDAIFDMIPGVGQIDDAAVVGICLYFVEQELLKYKNWKSMQ